LVANEVHRGLVEDRGGPACAPLAGRIDRPAGAAAADAIDGLLQRNPAERGESRSAKSRILFEGVLAVLFEVNEQDRTVYVTAVKRCR
jgi:hypothetical protein